MFESRSAQRLAAAFAAVLLLAPVRAYAHGHLKSSTPAAGAHLDAVPHELRLTFSEAPALAFTRVQLLDASGGSVALAPLVIAPNGSATVVATVSGAIVAGTYTVTWQMAGDDGHVTRGKYAFTIAPGAAGLAAPSTPAPAVTPPAPRESSTTALTPPATPVVPDAIAAPVPAGSAFDAGSPGYVIVRWLQYIGLLAVIGGVAFALVVLPRVARDHARSAALIEPARASAARLTLWAAALVAIAAVLRLVAQSKAMHNGMDSALLGEMLTGTVWGHGWIIQVVAVLVTAGALVTARTRQSGWTIAAVGALVLAFTPALSGHAASAPQLGALAVLADGLHVIGAAGWLGSLLFVTAVGVPAAMRLTAAERGPAVADLTHAFSPAALTFAGVTAVTGVFAAWLHLGTIPALWQSQYGQALLYKLAAVVIVAAIGAYNWRRLRPALGDVTSGPRLRRSATIELLVTLLVIATTAVLVATPTPMDDAGTTPSAAHTS